MTFTLPPHTPLIIPKVSPNGHWEFPETMNPSAHVGFVYAIYDTVMCRGYIGKKHYHSVQQARKVPSDWKSYTSSSTTVNLLLKHRPKEEFEFICIEEYGARGDLAYAESWSLYQVAALETQYWYNKGIESVGWKVKRPPSARHKERLAKVYQKVHG